MNLEVSSQIEYFFEIINQVLGWTTLVIGFLFLRHLRFKFQKLGLRIYLIGAGLFVLSEMIATFQFFSHEKEIIPQWVIEIVSQTIFSAFIASLGVAFYFLARTNQLELRELKVKIDTDKLTGLSTTKYLLDAGKLLFESSVQDNSVLSLMLINLDNFNSYKDTFGHDEGNVALQTVAKVLSDCARKEDVLARYGDEEFMMIIKADKIQAAAISKRIRDVVVEQCVPANHSQLKRELTISVGVSTRQDESDINELIKKADMALSGSRSDGKTK